MLTKEQVKQIRVKAKLTQKAFAEKVGVSTILVSMTETGQKPVSRKYAQQLADTFGDLKITLKKNYKTFTVSE